MAPSPESPPSSLPTAAQGQHTFDSPSSRESSSSLKIQSVIDAQQGDFENRDARGNSNDQRDDTSNDDYADEHGRNERRARGNRRRGATDMAIWEGQPVIKGKSETTRMILLTINAIGIAFTWSIEMTYCTPYLLKLGLTKSSTSLIWVAGPLSGLVVQPIVGAYADGSTSRWGRRRPLMVVCSILVAICLLVLGFTRELVDAWNVGEDEATAQSRTVVLAVIAIYCVDFAINAVMSCARSLIVDTLPIEKQQAGAAWSSRMSAIGHMMGYAAGAIDLVGVLGTALGDTQFKQLTIVSGAALLGTTGITCWAVKERVLMSAGPSKADGRFKLVRMIWSTLTHLPPRIQAICWAQFWSWIGWFPFLFYGTTWIGEIYLRYDLGPEDRKSEDVLGEMGRIGSTSMVLYSIITFVGAFLLPLVVQSPEERSTPQTVASAWRRHKPDLLQAWMGGHLLFSSAMLLAPFAHDYRFATFLVCLCGLPWALAMWAPSTFLGVEVNRLGGTSENSATAYRRVSNDFEVEMSSYGEEGGHSRQEGDEDEDEDDTTTDSSSGELSGIYFGILNIYTTLPQFIGTGMSALVFAIFEPGKSPELAGDPTEDTIQSGPNAISMCLFIGAISTLGAAWATRKLRFL